MKENLRTLKTLTAVALVALLIFGSSLSAFAASVTPLAIAGNDPTTGDYSGYTMIKFDPPSDGTKSLNGFSATADFSSNGKSVNFTTNSPVEYVFVKGSNGGNMYHYEGGTTSDTNLIAVVNNGGQQAAISHMTFYFKSTGKLTVNKTWVHGNNPVPPTQITVKLLENGTQIDSETFTGSYTFTGLDFGKTYTIVEDSIVNYGISYNGFISYVPANVDGTTVTITNTYIPIPEPEKGELTIKKVWLDSDNEPMDTHYTSIEVKLYIDNVAQEGVITLEADNDWEITLDDLDLDKVYKVVELSELGHFVTSYSDPVELSEEMMDGEFIITNTCTIVDPEDNPDILVTKSVTPASAQLVDGLATFNYTIVIKNTGNVTLEDVVFEDVMTGPEGATMSYSPTPDDIDLDEGIMLYDLETDLAPGESVTFNYSVTVNKVGTYDNVVCGYGWFEDQLICDEDEESVIVTETTTEPTTETPTNPTTETPTNPTTETPTNPTTETPTNPTTETPTNPTTETPTNPTTETPTNPTTETPTNPTTETPTNPTTETSTQSTITQLTIIPTTESATETITEEDIPLGAPEPFNVDQFLPNEPFNVDEFLPVDEEVILDEEIPLADALPQTGQLPMELYYGIGSVISLMGLAIRRKKNNENE